MRQIGTAIERLAVEYSELCTTFTDNRSAKIITVINGRLDCYGTAAPNILTRTRSGKLIDTNCAVGFPAVLA